MDCIIIQYFVKDIKDQYILETCLNSIKKTNLDVILVSHSPISESIQNKVKYFIYDSDDQLVNFQDALNYNLHLHAQKYYTCNPFYVYPYDFKLNDMAYTFYKAVHTAYKFCKAMNYDNSYYFVGDFIIEENEINDMLEISNKVKENNKMGYFEHDVVDSSGYSSLNPFFWYVNVSWFLDNCFPNMTTKQTFFKELKTPCFYEKVIFEKINNKKEDIIFIFKEKILENPISFIDPERCDLSKKYTKKIEYDHDTGIFYRDNIPHIFSWNLKPIDQKWKFIIEKPDNTIHKYVVDIKYGWNMIPIIDLDNNTNIKCYDLNQNKLYYDINIDNIEKYKNRYQIHLK